MAAPLGTAARFSKLYLFAQSTSTVAFDADGTVNSMKQSISQDTADNTGYGATFKAFLIGLYKNSQSIAGFYEKIGPNASAPTSAPAVLYKALQNSTAFLSMFAPLGDRVGNPIFGAQLASTSLNADADLTKTVGFSSNGDSQIGAE